MKRPQFLALLGSTLLTATLNPFQAVSAIHKKVGNYVYVYHNTQLKAMFFKFLKHVFHLFPEKEMHALIAQSAQKHVSDEAIYKEAQGQLSEITPSLSIINYQLPALFKQKEVMAAQAVTLLKKDAEFNGYLEIGSSGRYLDYLEEEVHISGNRYYADGKTPGYALPEMIDRGQVCIGAKYIPFTDYTTDYSAHMPTESVDLVTVYIGFHHCPIALRKSFIGSIHKVMRKGGKLVLRDHDCDNQDQTHLVALAHDVFNMGTYESWEYNQAEERHFYSLNFIIEFVQKIGFRFEEQTLFQEGDPTKNALMLFTKI